MTWLLRALALHLWPLVRRGDVMPVGIRESRRTVDALIGGGAPAASARAAGKLTPRVRGAASRLVAFQLPTQNTLAPGVHYAGPPAHHTK